MFGVMIQCYQCLFFMYIYIKYTHIYICMYVCVYHCDGIYMVLHTDNRLFSFCQLPMMKERHNIQWEHSALLAVGLADQAQVPKIGSENVLKAQCLP